MTTRLWTKSPQSGGVRANAAVETFNALPPPEDAEILDLTKLLNDQKELAGSERAAMVLSRFGKVGLPPLFSVLRNKQSDVTLRQIIVVCLEEQVTNAQSAVPLLRDLLTDSEVNLRMVATNALLAIDLKLPENAEKNGK